MNFFADMVVDMMLASLNQTSPVKNRLYFVQNQFQLLFHAVPLAGSGYEVGKPL